MQVAAARLFLDTSYAIALAISEDESHSRAVELADWLRANPAAGLITTQAVVIEIGDSFSRLRYRAAGIATLEVIQSDPRIQIVQLNDDVMVEAFALYRSRPDKEWGMTDCISFVVMK